jgi:hypothetical protein
MSDWAYFLYYVVFMMLWGSLLYLVILLGKLSAKQQWEKEHGKGDS